jgi:hypothetical protein
MKVPFLTASLKMPINDKTSALVSLKEIVGIVECPVCQELPKNCIVQCSNGHVGCDFCFSRLQTCPVCRVDMNHTAKTISDEKISEMLSELRDVETTTMLLNNEKLSGFFKCNWCKFVPTRQPIYQCKNGHWFCKKCVLEKMSIYCPKCNEDRWHDISLQLEDAPVKLRSIFSEQILYKIEKNCRFACYGCKEKFIGFSEHENYCNYREFICILGSPCPDVYVSMYNYLDHFKEKHSHHFNKLEED